MPTSLRCQLRLPLHTRNAQKLTGTACIVQEHGAELRLCCNRVSNMHPDSLAQTCHLYPVTYVAKCRYGWWRQTLGQLVHWHSLPAIWLDLATVFHSQLEQYGVQESN